MLHRFRWSFIKSQVMNLIKYLKLFFEKQYQEENI